MYEASDRVGGRCWTLRGCVRRRADRRARRRADRHRATRRSASSRRSWASGSTTSSAPRRTARSRSTTSTARRTRTLEASEDLNGIYQKLHRDVSEASYPTLFDSYTARGARARPHVDRRLDRGERARRDARRSSASCSTSPTTIEYGAESSDQSSLNLLYLLGYSGQGQFRIFGPSNEKYHVRGGNDQIPSRWPPPSRARVEARARAGRHQARIRRRTYSLTFRDRPGTKTVAADRVVLALPFSILRLVGRLRQGGIRAAQGDGDRGAGHGNELEAPPPVRPALLGRASAATARRSPTPVTRRRGT